MDSFMLAAIAEARQDLAEGGNIGRGHNWRVQKDNPTLHGEMDAVANAGRLPASDYRQSVLFTTLSPCAVVRFCYSAFLKW